VQVKPQQVKNHLSVFINCLIENPTFDSQTKENMTLKVSAFGSKASVSDEFLKKSKTTSKNFPLSSFFILIERSLFALSSYLF